MNKLYAKLTLVLVILALVAAIIACDVTKGCTGPLCQKDTKYSTLSVYVDPRFSQEQLNVTMTARVPYLESLHGVQP